MMQGCPRGVTCILCDPLVCAEIRITVLIEISLPIRHCSSHKWNVATEVVCTILWGVSRCYLLLQNQSLDKKLCFMNVLVLTPAESVKQCQEMTFLPLATLSPVPVVLWPLLLCCMNTAANIIIQSIPRLFFIHVCRIIDTDDNNADQHLRHLLKRFWHK